LVGADAKEVERGLKSEERIGQKAYLAPGGPFAGGTLARDVDFLGQISQKYNLPNHLLTAIKLSNNEHKKWVRRKISDNFTSFEFLRVAIWGLTYKPGTDTLRGSLSVELVDWLLEYGAHVQIYDPVVKELPSRWNLNVRQCEYPLENLDKMQVLVLGTEWTEFKDAARQLPRIENSNLIIIDSNRYLFDSIKGVDIKYLSVGLTQDRF
jgi:UDPglucose 6-dehydrogenase